MKLFQLFGQKKAATPPSNKMALDQTDTRKPRATGVALTQPKIAVCTKCKHLLYEYDAVRVSLEVSGTTGCAAFKWTTYYCPADKPPFDRILISAEETKYYKEIPQQWVEVTEEGEETTDA